jgi:ABC-2 type transport system ATP-binding protein
VSTPAIHAEELTKRFASPDSFSRIIRQPIGRPRREVVAVDQVSLDVRAGELFGLLGPNGAGKTTLIKLLCTLITPTSGSAQIEGIDLHHASRVLQVVGMASGDERSFYWRLSGRANLEFFAVLYGLDRRAAQQRAAELLTQFGLAEQAERPFRTYSSGQKQRLSIARALLPRPRVLFLDEPTRSLDPTATMNLHGFIEEELLRREGMTILLTTHRLDEAQRLCQRIAIMDKGRIQACGTPDELRARLSHTISYELRVAGLATDPAALGAGLPGQLRWTPLPAANATGIVSGAWLVKLEATGGEAALAALIGRIVQAGGQVQDVSR